MANAAGPDRAWMLHAVSWPLFGISAIVTALRLWVRLHIIHSYGWDDALILVAMSCATVNTALVAVSILHGTGRHMDELTKSQQILSGKFQLLSQGFHVMSTNWGKVSVALFLVRIISGVKQHKQVMYAGMILLTIINGLGVYTIYGQCTPTAKIWNSNLEGSCWPSDMQRDYAFFQGSVSAFTDLVLAVYPLFTISRLQMATKVKVGLGFVLSLGIIAMGAAIIKTVHLAALSSRTDYTWDMIELTIWVTVEQYFIILAASIPALTPLFNIAVRYRSTKRTSTRNTKRIGVGYSRQLSRPQPYSHFASVGREYVEYPVSWARSERRHQGSRSDSEIPIIIAEEQKHGILRTTEFQLQRLPRDEEAG
ncbi:hypothetical protein P175DRAFT_0547648 [Aspergillus ochraceoroseus IBT 24754]|uniref:Rhodopsin domain-containing protein n=1 Tax=Aspergillus ochraceoroseus IBT 24754 TaxID=1392256 RepID=A0A2T5LTY4_9EURO|nr:uncharacterized protein P175DRAFT_0547648 [Aspergillus ochraceoroseus IBT 24754]PTU19741.1 hypothetical protein P175DRAFT_0547648 [Aspergillus ochraceoroseus IBT 24754]